MKYRLTLIIIKQKEYFMNVFKYNIKKNFKQD